MAERSSSGLLTMMLEPTPAVGMTLPAEVREKLAELELELSEGEFAGETRPWSDSCDHFVGVYLNQCQQLNRRPACPHFFLSIVFFLLLFF